jgi:ABC transporter DrrB family efflux protein
VSATTETPQLTLAPQPRGGVAQSAHDSLVVAKRNLLRMLRIPEVVIFGLVQPIMFVVLFSYVFGGSVAVGGSLSATDYRNFLMAGIFAQTVTFATAGAGAGIADDMSKGLIDRFRSLPMARSAVLVGRTGADLVRNFFVVLLMCVVGFIVGWTVETSFLGLVGAFLVILGFAYAMSWVFAIVGLSVRDAETAQAVSFPLLAVLVFASSAFVPVATMPSWLQGWARNQPVSVVIDAVRYLTIGSGPGLHAASVWKAIAWIVAIIVVAAPIAVSRYRKAV